ncbi:MAG: Mur ligase domain-containing protein, partial [Egibacteraceae bacterium]
MTTLSDVLAVLPPSARLHAGRGAQTDRSLVLADVTHDSRSAGPGVLFACRPGQVADGHDFGPAAVAAGSPALLVERPLDVGVPQVQVDSVAATLGDAIRAHEGVTIS